MSGSSFPPIGVIEEALAMARQPVHRARDAKHTPVAHGIPFRGGLIDAPVHGRTDKIPLNLPSGSYVLPADIVSALGQGNTRAGAAVIQEVTKGAPYASDSGGAYGSTVRPEAHGSGPPGPSPGGPPTPPPDAEQLGDVAGPEPPHMKGGGKNAVCPIVAAGGEYVLTPAEVKWLGNGDLARGYRWLDAFVNAVRRKHIETLKKLKPPKAD